MLQAQIPSSYLPRRILNAEQPIIEASDIDRSLRITVTTGRPQ